MSIAKTTEAFNYLIKGIIKDNEGKQEEGGKIYPKVIALKGERKDDSYISLNK